MDGPLAGLLDALAGLVKHPTLAHAAQAFLSGDAVTHAHATVRTEGVYKAARDGEILVENEIFPQDTYRLWGDCRARRCRRWDASSTA